MNSTAGTIKHRHQISAEPDNPDHDVSRNVWNDSEPIDSVAVDGSVLVRDSGQTDGYGFTTLRRVYPLGGSRINTLPLSSGEQNVPDWLDIELDGDEYGSLNIKARVEVRVQTGDTIIPRVYNVTDDSVAGTGVVCSGEDADYSGVDQIQTFDVGLAPGIKKYRLQGFMASGIGCWAIGYLEIGG